MLSDNNLEIKPISKIIVLKTYSMWKFLVTTQGIENSYHIISFMACRECTACGWIYVMMCRFIGVRDGPLPIFRAVWEFIRAFCPKSTQICPNSVLIFKITLFPYCEYSIRIQRVCLHARNFVRQKSVDSGNLRCDSGSWNGLPPLWNFPRTPMLWTVTQYLLRSL